MSHRAQVVGFGPYLYDLELGRLLHGEQVIRMPEQTARLLTCLIQKSGRLATRSELRSELWPDAPPSDIEQAINKRISQLRTLLADNADKPLYIETIPQRGYRFCAEVYPLATSALPPADPAETAAFSPAELPLPTSHISGGEVASASRTSSFPWLRLTAFALLAALASVVIFLVMRHRASAPPASSGIVTAAFAPFESTSPQCNEAAANLRSDLIDRLASSPRLRVIAANSSNGLRPDSTLTAQAAKLGLDLVVFGYLTSDGDKYSLRLELVRPADSTHIATFRYTANLFGLSHIRVEAINDILDRMKLKAATGPDLGGTANPKAFDAYMHGRYQSSQLSDDAVVLALADFKQAVQLDPHFGDAYICLAQAYIWLASRHRLPQQEAFVGAQDAVDHALQVSPSLAMAHVQRSRLFLDRDWNLPAAIQEATLATQLQSGSGGTHANLAWVLTVAGDYSAARSELALARPIDPFDPGVDYVEMYIDFGLHDCSRALALSDKIANDMSNLPDALNLAAWGKWTCGHQPQAIALWRKVAILYNDPAWAALEDSGLQTWQAHGDKAYARPFLHALQTHSLSKNYEITFDPEEWAAVAGQDQLALQIVRGRVAQHDSEFFTDLLSPSLASVRHTPEFQSILHSASF